VSGSRSRGPIARTVWLSTRGASRGMFRSLGAEVRSTDVRHDRFDSYPRRRLRPPRKFLMVLDE
jgi:hypothetical protein